VQTFKSRPQDQQKVRLAISLRRVDPEDIPESSKTKPLGAIPTGPSDRPSQKKRKADQDKLLTSQAATASTSQTPIPSTLQAPSSVTIPSATQLAEDEHVEDIPEEVKDEIYCNLNTNVVGIQYYKGLLHF